MPLKRNKEITYSVISTAERLDTYLPDTLESLAKAGFDVPCVYLDGAERFGDYRILSRDVQLRVVPRVPRIGALGNWLLALMEMYIRKPHSTFFLIFQDDILICPGTREYLMNCRYPSGNNYYNLYTVPGNEKWKVPKNKEGKSVVGWHKSNQQGKGALGLLMTGTFVKYLILNTPVTKRIESDPHKRGIDGVVIKTAERIHWKEYIHFPSFVQHVGRGTTLKNEWKEPSTCFYEDIDMETLL